MKIDGGHSVIKVFLVNEESRHVQLNETMDVRVHEGSVVDSCRGTCPTYPVGYAA